MCNTCKVAVCKQCNDCKDTPRRNTPDEMIEVCKALKDGKTLEIRKLGMIDNIPFRWQERACHQAASPNFAGFQYRVKREARTLHARMNKYDQFLSISFDEGTIAAGMRADDKHIKFVEVPE